MRTQRHSHYRGMIIMLRRNDNRALARHAQHGGQIPSVLNAQEPAPLFAVDANEKRIARSVMMAQRGSVHRSVRSEVAVAVGLSLREMSLKVFAVGTLQYSLHPEGFHLLRVCRKVSERQAYRCLHFWLNLRLPTDLMSSTSSMRHRSSTVERTCDMCTPRLRWIPEQSRQIKMP